MVTRKQQVILKTADAIQRGDMFDIGGTYYKVVNIKTNHYGDKVFELSRTGTKQITTVIIDRQAPISTTVTRG